MYASQKMALILMAVTVATFAILPAANAAMATFNFDADKFNTSTPFTDTVTGVSATFSSPASPGAFAVEPAFQSAPITGNQLYEATAVTPLDIVFNSPGVTGFEALSLDFVTQDPGPASTLSLTAYAGGLTGKIVGTMAQMGVFSQAIGYPEGTLSFSSATPFDTVVVSDVQVPLAIDNLSVSRSVGPTATVPEAGSFSLSILGLACVGGMLVCTRRRRV